MAEDITAAGTNAAAGLPDGADFSIKKLYVKDVSFESPGAPQIFTRQWQPGIELQLHTDAMRFSPADYEVTLTGTVTAKADADETAFLAEVQVAGIFAVTGLTEEELAPVLAIYCPSILFPFVREVVADLSVRGGFPQVVLAPVNFDALYAAQNQPNALAADPSSA